MNSLVKTVTCSYACHRCLLLLFFLFVLFSLDDHDIRVQRLFCRLTVYSLTAADRRCELFFSLVETNDIFVLHPTIEPARFDSR